jgi:hypothetical protein
MGQINVLQIDNKWHYCSLGSCYCKKLNPCFCTRNALCAVQARTRVRKRRALSPYLQNIFEIDREFCEARHLFSASVLENINFVWPTYTLMKLSFNTGKRLVPWIHY